MSKKFENMRNSIASQLATSKAKADTPEGEAKEPTDGEVIEVEENIKKKAIFFHSSVAKDLDVE